MKLLTTQDLQSATGGVQIRVEVGANDVAEWFYNNMPDSWRNAFGEALYQACWECNIGNWYSSGSGYGGGIDGADCPR
jgi:hypothetical protein